MKKLRGVMKETTCHYEKGNGRMYMGKPKANKKKHKHNGEFCEECGKEMHEVNYVWDDNLEEYVCLEKDGKKRRLTDAEQESIWKALERHALESY